jgi:hypothetical protein
MPGYGFSADNMAHKGQFVQTGWSAQIAGAITECGTILKDPSMKHDFGAENASLGDVQRVFLEAYRRQRIAVVEAKLLAPYGLSLNQFMKQGRNMFNERDHENLIDEIKKETLDAEFLVSGFDAKKEPHIFGVCDPGQATDYDKMGFWAIGSGTHSALGMMFAQKYNVQESLPLCLYKVLAAKFAAESAEGVGKETVVYVLNPAAPLPLWLNAEEVSSLRNRYEALKRVPEGIESQIDGYLKNRIDSLTEFLQSKHAPTLAVATKALNEEPNPTPSSPETSEDQQ